MWLILAQTTPDTEGVDQAVPEGLTMGDWLFAGGIFAVSLVLAFVLGKLLDRVTPRLPNGPTELVRRIARVLVAMFGLIYALSSIGVDVGLFIGALGIGGIALAFAFQDILENFVAGMILQAKRPFRRGSWVEIGASQLFGIVQDIDSRSVIIDTFDGNRIVLPAAEVLKNPIVNWTVRGRHRMDVPIAIAYRTDPAEAVAAIEPRLEAIPELLAHPAPRVLITELGESSVNLVAYVWHESFSDLFWIRHRVLEEAKAALVSAGIEIPFPQRVVSFAPDDGANVIDVRGETQDASADRRD